MKRILLKVLKVIGWILLSIILLLTIIILSLRFPAVQKFVTDKAVNFYIGKTNTEASLDRLYVDFPHNITLEKLYLADQEGDTLLYVNYLTINTDLWALLDNQLNLEEVETNGIKGQVIREGDPARFNFQFIIDAFASADTTATSQGGFDFSLENVTIENSDLAYRDTETGMDARLDLGYLQVIFSEFDLNTSSIIFDEVIFSNSTGELTLTEPQPTQSGDYHTPSTAYDTEEVLNLGFGTASLSEIDFTFSDEVGKIRIQNNIGQLEVEADSFSIENNVYVAENVNLSNTFVSIDLFDDGSQTDSIMADTTTSEEAVNILTGTKKAFFNKVSFRLHDHSAPIQSSGFDPMHFWLQQVNADIEGAMYKDGEAEGTINQFALTEKNGFVLKELNGQVAYKNDSSYLKNLTLATELSDVHGYVVLTYPSKAEITDVNMLYADVNLSKSYLHMADVYYWQPALKQQMGMPFNGVQFQIDAEGRLGDIRADQLQLRLANNTRLKLSGRVKGLPEMNNTSIDVSLSYLETSARDLNQLIPDSLKPANVTFPEQLIVSLEARGNLTDLDTDGDLKSSLGDIGFQGHIRQEPDSIYAYEGNVNLEAFDLGRLLQQPQLDTVTLALQVDGRGFDLNTLNTEVVGKVERLGYSGYTYQNLDINGRFESMMFNGKLDYKDDNLEFDFDGLVNLNDSVPKYLFTLDIPAADLEQLQLTKQDLKLRARIDADLSVASIQSFQGTVTIDNFVVSSYESIFLIDTLSLNSNSRQGQTDITLASTIADANFHGNFELSTLPAVLTNHLSRYFSVADSVKHGGLQPQNFEFDIDIKRPDFFSAVLVPGLTELEPGQIKGVYNSEKWLIDIDIDMEQLTYLGTEVDSLGIGITSDEYSLDYAVGIDKIKRGAFAFNNVLLEGSIGIDHATTDLYMRDENGTEKYHLGGILTADDFYRFQFTPGKFVLNYNSWDVKPSNSIDIYPDGRLWINNFLLNYENQQLSVQSSLQEKDSLLSINVRDFKLDFLGTLPDQEIKVLGGNLGGEFVWNTSDNNFNADMLLEHFSFKGDTVGNIDIALDGQNQRTDVDVKVQSRYNDLAITGFLQQQEEMQLNLDVDMPKLDLSTVGSFARPAISKMEGGISGNMTVRGTGTDPDVRGSIEFNEAKLTIAQLGTTYTIDNEQVRFTRTGINFNGFELTDSNNQSLSVNGDIWSEDYSDFDFGLDIRAKDFLVLNTDQKQNDLFYGNLKINSTIKVRGNKTRPQVNLNVDVVGGSDVTYVVPAAEVEVQQRKGIVEFFDADIENDPFFKSEKLDVDTVENWIQGLNLTANIELNDQSIFHIVIDPVTGDQLSVAGNTNLTYKMTPTGDITLSGRYEVTDGSYDLNFYGLVKRKFDIQKGSYLQWSGDPLNALVDITAIYTVRAAPLDADFNRKVPFNVFLDMQGELLTPDISFRIGMEEGSAPTSVQTYVNNINQNESDLNQQVFSLLLFKTFMSAGSTAGDGNVASSTARNSVSRILNNQLSKLSGKIQGVEVSVDVDSYQDYDDEGSAVGRTELELGLSKQFFNDRVVVKVAGSFDVEGNERQRNTSDFAGDVRIEYKLTEDGRYRLVGFRQNEYDNLIQGEISETGVGIIFVRDYNTFKELFKLKDSEKNSK